MNRNEIKEVVSELEKTIIPYSVLEELLKHIVENTTHFQNKPNEDRFNEALEALWGDRVNRSSKKGRPKERSDLYYVGKMYDQLRSDPNVELDNTAWKAALEAIGDTHIGSSTENFKNRLINKFRKSPQSNFAEQFQSPKELIYTAMKNLEKLQMRELKIVTSWLENKHNFKISDE